MISVVLADDQAMIRAGLRLILEAEDDVKVVGEASDGEQAIEITRQAQPDVVLMDVQMPKLDGIEATRRIGEAGAISSRVLILTTFEQDEYVFEALRAGASGFLLKNAPPEELVQAVRIVAAGDALLAPSITRRVIEDYTQRSAPPKDDSAALASLTERELEVLRLLATGKSNAELAAQLYLGEGTIKTHVSHVLSKLGLRDRVQAVVFAYETGPRPARAGLARVDHLAHVAHIDRELRRKHLVARAEFRAVSWSLEEDDGVHRVGGRLVVDDDELDHWKTPPR